MELPVYTELSNFSVRKGGKKAVADLSVVLIADRHFDPVEAINSVFQFVSKSRLRTEFMLISSDREGLKFDRLMATFPAMRVLFPERELKPGEAIALGTVESIAPNVLFMDSQIRIVGMDDEILELYLKEVNYGMVIPLVCGKEDTVLPDVVQGSVEHGFLRTSSRDIVGTAVPSLSAKYFCFILNRDVFVSREIRLTEYGKTSYLLLELGYKLWKEGCRVVQARNFKVHYVGEPLPDIDENLKDADYLSFHFNNLVSRPFTVQRAPRLLRLILASLFTFQWKRIGTLAKYLSVQRKKAEQDRSKPVDDAAIFAIVNRDM
jgi:hypothetical protein